MKADVFDSEVAVENPWTKVVRERVGLPGGATGDFLIVERPPAVAVLPLFIMHGELHTALVEQYRHPIQTRVLQFPMGGLDHDQELIEQARCELKEETGIELESFTLLTDYWVDPGLSRQRCFVFVAEGSLTRGPQQLDETEGGMTVHIMRVSELPRLVRDGRISDGWGLAQVPLLLEYVAHRY
jgi:8-oxo-dGTP pyrophosphatase MutT (NUDIX family)